MKQKIKDWVESNKDSSLTGAAAWIAWEKLRATKNLVTDLNPYKSQSGQDRFVDTHFNGSPGFYVDVGAHEGRENSNTFFLQFMRGWHGICVEPNQKLFPALSELRQDPTCLCLPYALDNYSGEADFIEADWWGTIKHHLTPEHEQEFLQGVPQRVVKFPVRPLQDLLDTHQIRHVNYLSLDTEGNELQVLQGVDWDRTTFDLMSIENNWGDDSIKNYLDGRGYAVCGHLGVDDIYSRRQFNLSA